MEAPFKNPTMAPSQPLDTVTILWVQPGKFASKQFSKTATDAKVNVRGYNAGLLYTLPAPIGVSCIEELSEVLTVVERQPRVLIIRGAPVSVDLIDKDVRRKGSDEGGNFVGNFQTPSQGRHYLEIDVDKLPLPKGWTLDQASISKICEFVIHKLPPEFHDASYHWQLSSSAGVFDQTKVSAHLWFWLAKPIPDLALRAWAEHVNDEAGVKLIDPALFQHVQPHYIAAPSFKGMDDPFPVRSGLVIKSSGQVDFQLPPPESVSHIAGTASGGTFNTSGGSGFEYHLSQIGDHPGGDGFHMPIVQAAASYVGEHGTEDTDVEALFSIIQQRVLTADGSKHSRSEVEGRASRDHIMSAITSGLRKYGDAASQHRKSRRLLGLTPDVHDAYQDIATIEVSIDALLDQVF